MKDVFYLILFQKRIHFIYNKVIQRNRSITEFQSDLDLGVIIGLICYYSVSNLATTSSILSFEIVVTDFLLSGTIVNICAFLTLTSTKTILNIAGVSLEKKISSNLSALRN